MVWLRRMLVICGIVCVSLLCESKILPGKNKFPTLLSMFNAYKIGNRDSFRVPAIIVIPLVTQKQSVTLYKTDCDKAINDNKSTDKLNTIKTSSNFGENVENNNDIEIFLKPKRDVESNDELALDKHENIDNFTETSENINNDENITHTINFTTTLTPIPTTIKNTEGPYPTPQYNNSIDTISITTEGIQQGKTFVGSHSLIDKYSEVSNKIIDHKIQYLPPTNDIRWASFTNLTTTKNEFQPLAGLYYDGFLHRPLKKYYFVPTY
ncbi:hypothetical protein ACJJTC_001776 [Scirpophaga incertulas]